MYTSLVFHKTQLYGNVRWNQFFWRSTFAPPGTPLARRLLVYFASGAYRAFTTLGRWEGDTLVVDTNGLRDGMWLDRAGTPLTDTARVTERFRRINYGNMEIEVTVNDPRAYRAPWTTTIKQYIVLNTELLDYICLENEEDRSHFE